MGETEPVELADLVEACWQTVETASAGLVVETETTIQADPSRLQQLFENLLRNAVEHGGEDVTITIGDLPDGFYVEDDGQEHRRTNGERPRRRLLHRSGRHGFRTEYRSGGGRGTWVGDRGDRKQRWRRAVRDYRGSDGGLSVRNVGVQRRSICKIPTPTEQVIHTQR